ncbi:hypothetical protein STEG23_019829 [Scotinomys teguina]
MLESQIFSKAVEEMDLLQADIPAYLSFSVGKQDLSICLELGRGEYIQIGSDERRKYNNKKGNKDKLERRLCLQAGTTGEASPAQLVSAEPEVGALACQAEDEFVLLASDDLRDTLSGVDLAGLVALRICLRLAREKLCAQLLDVCLCKGSLDNMTCMVVCFPGAPRPCEEAIRREMALDAALSHKVAELYSSAQEPPCLNAVFRTLESEDIPGLPPGGGSHSKATVIAEAYSKLHQTPEECQEKS